MAYTIGLVYLAMYLIDKIIALTLTAALVVVVAAVLVVIESRRKK